MNKQINIAITGESNDPRQKVTQGRIFPDYGPKSADTVSGTQHTVCGNSIFSYKNGNATYNLEAGTPNANIKCKTDFSCSTFLFHF